MFEFMLLGVVVIVPGLAVPLTFVATVVLVAPVAPFTEVVVVVLVVVLAFDDIVLVTMAELLFIRLAFAVELLAESPQAIPRAPKARTVESAITFFM